MTIKNFILEKIKNIIPSIYIINLTQEVQVNLTLVGSRINS